MENGTGHSILNVDGSGSLWNGHSFYIGGANRSAEINVTGGGSVLADNFFCAQAAGLCEVTISGAGSALTAGYTVSIGQAGPATLTLAEGGVFSHTNLGGTGVDVTSAATLVFGIGNGSKISTTGNATIADGATIGLTFDSGFTPTVGLPYDLVTAGGTLTVNPGALNLDESGLPAGWSAVLGEGSLQATFDYIPEPGTLGLLALGGLLLGRCRRKG